GSLCDLVAKLLQFTMNASCTPTSVLAVHLKDQTLQFCLDYSRKAAAAFAFVSPVVEEPAAMPLDHRFWLCNAQPPQGLRVHTIEPAPKESIDWFYQWRVALRALKDTELMAECYELKFQGHSLPKAEREQLD